MTVTVDNAALVDNGFYTSLGAVTTFAVGASTNGLLFIISFYTGTFPTGISVQWDSKNTPQAMTQVASYGSSGSTPSVFIYGLLAPHTGTLSFGASWTGTCNYACGAVSLIGVNQASLVAAFTNANTNNGTTTPAGINITSASGNIAVAGFSAGSGGSVSSVTQSEVFINDTNAYGAAAYAAGVTSTAFSATLAGNATWGAAGINVVPGVGGNTNLPLLGVGGMVGWRATLGAAVAWRLAGEIKKNGVITRRGLLLPGRRCYKK